jgi:hypothetical protein
MNEWMKGTSISPLPNRLQFICHPTIWRFIMCDTESMYNNPQSYGFCDLIIIILISKF